MKTTVFNDFLEAVNLDDYNEIYELANAAYNEESGNFYEVIKNGDILLIKCTYTDATLVLSSQAARDAFRIKMEKEYMDDLDQESYWGYQHALDKSNEEDARHNL